MESPMFSVEGPKNDAGKWIFTLDQVESSPSIVRGFSKAKEAFFRRQATNLIQDMGHELKLNQLCINTSIVYCQRFYMFHPFQLFPRHLVAPAAVFLAAKVEEQPRKIEHILKIAHNLRHKNGPPLKAKSEIYKEKEDMLLLYEDILLQTLGFELGVDHPHFYIVRETTKLSAPKEISQSSYFLASNVLLNTTMCLRYTPKMIACFCIFMANKAAKDKISTPSGSEEEWIKKVDRNATLEIMNDMFEEYIDIELGILDEGEARQCPETKVTRGATGLSKNVSEKVNPKEKNCAQLGSRIPRNEKSMGSLTGGKDRVIPEASRRAVSQGTHKLNSRGEHHSLLMGSKNHGESNKKEQSFRSNGQLLDNGGALEPFSVRTLDGIHPTPPHLPTSKSNSCTTAFLPSALFSEKLRINRQVHKSSSAEDSVLSFESCPKLPFERDVGDEPAYRPFDQQRSKGDSLEQHLLGKIKQPLTYEEVLSLKENVEENSQLERVLSGQAVILIGENPLHGELREDKINGQKKLQMLAEEASTSYRSGKRQVDEDPALGIATLPKVLRGCDTSHK